MITRFRSTNFTSEKTFDFKSSGTPFNFTTNDNLKLIIIFFNSWPSQTPASTLGRRFKWLKRFDDYFNFVFDIESISEIELFCSGSPMTFSLRLPCFVEDLRVCLCIRPRGRRSVGPTTTLSSSPPSIAVQSLFTM